MHPSNEKLWFKTVLNVSNVRRGLKYHMNMYFDMLNILVFCSKIYDMAKQRGVNEIHGTIGNITYYNMNGSFYAKGKSNITREKYFNNPRNEMSWKNNGEFGYVAQSGRLFRSVLWDLIQNSKDVSHTSRMTSLMLEIRLTDIENDLGYRKIWKGNLELLKGYQFNKGAPIENIIQVNYSSSIDRERGNAVIEFPSFSPEGGLKYPEGCTHFRIVSRCVFLDFEKSIVSFDEKSTGHILIGAKEIEAFSLTYDIGSFKDLHIVMVMGIQFFALINGKMEISTNKEYNSLSILDVSKR